MNKLRLAATIGIGAMRYILKIARKYSISKSKAVEFLLFVNECEIDDTKLDYYYNNLFKWTDGRKGRKMRNNKGES